MRFAHAHTLLIGVGSYVHAPQLNVPVTATDASAVATVLTDPQYCGYPLEHVTLLTDAGATRVGVLDALDALAVRVRADDTVLIFYGGHGAYGDDGYALTTYDTRLDTRKIVSGSGLREAELIAKLHTVRARRLVLIVNACHAGEISPVLAPGEEPLTGAPLPPQVAAALLGTGEGRVILSACREQQYAFIGPGPLTLFTQALVDGLRGMGVPSNCGYINVFDLYTHLYFTLDEAVPRQVPAAVRQHYGEQQEPELTILKGVEPFAIALYRGATPRSAFAASGSLPEGTAVRAINPAYSQAMLRQYQQAMGGNTQVGTAVASDVHSDVTVPRQGDSGQRGGISFGSGNRTGNITVGDVAGRDLIKTNITQGDQITTGDISGSGIAIGRGARSTVRTVNTGGGDYAEGHIDKRKGTFVSGDQFTMSGNVSGAMLNMKATLTNVSQSIGAAPQGDAAPKAQIQALIAQLSAELQKVPAEKVSEAEAVVETAKTAVEQATKAQPNKTMVQISVEGLQQAAQNLTAVLPTVLPLAERIAEVLQRMVVV
jgi:hypothetical protein